MRWGALAARAGDGLSPVVPEESEAQHGVRWTTAWGCSQALVSAWVSLSGWQLRGSWSWNPSIAPSSSAQSMEQWHVFVHSLSWGEIRVCTSQHKLMKQLFLKENPLGTGLLCPSKMLLLRCLEV